MPQIHYRQHGIFHVITRTKKNRPWCTDKGTTHILINHLSKTRDVHGGLLHAFCILPNHIHIILCPGEKGLSSFMQSFKSNSIKELHTNKFASEIAWQEGFYDERIRSEEQRTTAMGYVLGNGMKHGLATTIEGYPWTSLHFEKVIDPLDLW